MSVECCYDFTSARIELTFRLHPYSTACHHQAFCTLFVFFYFPDAFSFCAGGSITTLFVDAGCDSLSATCWSLYTLTDEVVFEMLWMKRCIVIGVIVNSVASEMVVKAKCRAVIGGNDKVDSGAGEIVGMTC